MKSNYCMSYCSTIGGEFTADMAPANNSYPINNDPIPHRRH